MVLCGISTCFQVLSPCLGQVAHALLTRPPLELPELLPKLSAHISSFDLHVLSTPPAFVLSQDQTLMFNPFPPASPTHLGSPKPPLSLRPWRFTHRILTVSSSAARLSPHGFPLLSLRFLAPRLPGSSQFRFALSFPLYRFQGSPAARSTGLRSPCLADSFASISQLARKVNSCFG